MDWSKNATIAPNVTFAMGYGKSLLLKEYGVFEVTQGNKSFNLIPCNETVETKNFFKHHSDADSLWCLEYYSSYKLKAK